MRINRTREAFTLIELMVVVAIIAILIAILVPSLSRARQQAYQIKCMANLKNIGLGMFLYVQDQSGSLPALSGQGRDLGFWPAQVARYARVKRSRAGSRDGFFRCPADEEPTYFHISGPTPGQYATMQDKLLADSGQATDGGGTTRRGALGAGQTPHAPMPLIEPVPMTVM